MYYCINDKIKKNTKKEKHLNPRWFDFSLKSLHIRRMREIIFHADSLGPEISLSKS